MYDRQDLKVRLTACKCALRILEMPARASMDTDEIAMFYNVAPSTIYAQFARNKEQFLRDGAYIPSDADYALARSLYKEGVQVPNADIIPRIEMPESCYDCWDYDVFILFPKRAIIRMGTHLRNNLISRVINEALVEFAENPDGGKYAALKTEIQLLESLLHTQSREKTEQAETEYKDFQNRHLYTIEPYFDQESKLYDLYQRDGKKISLNALKLRIARLFLPNQKHKTKYTHQEAIKRVCQKIALEKYNRTELTDEERNILSYKG